VGIEPINAQQIYWPRFCCPRFKLPCHGDRPVLHLGHTDSVIQRPPERVNVSAYDSRPDLLIPTSTPTTRLSWTFLRGAIRDESCRNG
ncbi:MAG: hypothetical protein QOE89_204, partial [Pseudonocardiales bacterium]|nr:hypothetical protein [Pseudonocardiales bacterium]